MIARRSEGLSAIDVDLGVPRPGIVPGAMRASLALLHIIKTHRQRHDRDALLA
jgi:hypothetical protein